jgi:hypothetical protein
MSVFIIKFKTNIIGIYYTLKNATDYVYSLYNSKFINSNDKVYIQEFKINTNIILNEYNLNLKYEITKKININYDGSINEHSEFYEDDSSTISSSKSDDEKISLGSTEKERIKQNNKDYIKKQNIIGQQKIDVVHELNLLKEQQKILEENEKKYNADLELYYKFKNIKSTSTNFDIPFMFEEKYKTFEYLEVENILDYKNFTKKYKPTRVKTTYDDLFEIKEPLSDSESEIDETFSNVDSSQLFIATNQ